MRNRQPTKPGRVLLTPENGNTPFYAIMEMADEPTDIGTPPTKENLLTDDTEAAIFGSAADRTVNQALGFIAGRLSLISGNLAEIELTVVTTSGNPVPNMPIAGAFDANGDTLVTNASGKASGYVSEGNITLSVSGYADIQNYSETMAVAKGQSYKKTITLSTINFVKLTSSKSVKFSPNVSRVDVTVVGGGGSGGTGKGDDGGGGGGGGGYCTVKENVSFTPGTSYQATIGAGGKGIEAYDPRTGNDGGSSSFMGITADGGKGGTGGFSGSNAGGAGNGAGGTGVSSNKTPGAGSPGSVLGYSSFTATVRYGGGGGGAKVRIYGGGGAGGADFGAAGGGNGKGSSAANGTGGGGGGGGGEYVDSDISYGAGGNGGSGCVAIRMHLTAT